MFRRLLPIALVLLSCALSASARTAFVPLDPAALAGAGVFVQAEQAVARAAQAAGTAFVPDSRPLPPQVVMTFDTPDGKILKRRGVLFWRGDMLPDQLAPGETGALVRRHQSTNGVWRTARTRENTAPASDTNLVSVSRATGTFALPPMIIETPYRLGTIGDAPVLLVLWRTAEEDSAPLGGAIALRDPPPSLLDALQAQIPPFPAQADWAAAFDALSP